MTDTTTEVLTGARLVNGAVVGGVREQLTQDEVARRFAEITDNNKTGWNAVLTAKAMARTEANRLARASKSLKATILAGARTMKLDSAFNAGKNLLRSIAGRAGAAASKVATICSPGLAGSALLVSKEVRDLVLDRVIVPVAQRVMGAALKANHYWSRGLHKVGLGRLADWQSRNLAAALFAVAMGFQTVRSYLDSKEDSGAFRWARYFVFNKIANNAIKAFVPAQYRTAVYVMWLLWGGSVVQKRNSTQAPPPFSQQPAPSSGWKVSQVSVINPATANTFDAEAIVTDRGDTIYRVDSITGATEYFTAVGMDGLQIVPRGSVTYGVDGATTDPVYSAEVSATVDLQNAEVARRQRHPRKRAAATPAEAPKATATPKQVKKRPAKPPVVKAAEVVSQ